MNDKTEIRNLLEQLAPEIEADQAIRNIGKTLHVLGLRRRVGRLSRRKKSLMKRDEEIMFLVMAMCADDNGTFEATEELIFQMFRKLYGLADELIEQNLDVVN